MIHTSDRITASSAREGEVRHVPEGGVRNFGQDPEGGTVNVAREGDPTKSGYLNFEPGGMYTTSWRPTGDQVSEYSISHGGKPSSYNRQDPTGS